MVELVKGDHNNDFSVQSLHPITSIPLAFWQLSFRSVVVAFRKQVGDWLADTF